MPVSRPVLAYYAERIHARSGRDTVPPNFRPLPRPPTGRSVVEGCRGGGKNVLEVALVGSGGRVEDVRVSCGLCNAAMMVASDILADWARGRPFEEILGADPLAPASLDPLFAALGGGGRPADAAEKLRYALVAVQNAVRDHLGEPPRPAPDVPPGADDAGAEEGDAPPGRP